MIWRFFRQREMSTSQQQLLFMQSEQTTLQPDTTMFISAPAATTPGQFAFLELDDADYLFLRTAKDSYRCVPRDYGVSCDFGMEILYEERDRGKIFMCDIYVCSVTDLCGLGLNYLGTSKSMTATLGLSRDRNSVNASALIPQLGKLLYYSRQHSQTEHDRAVRLFLNVLHEKPTSALRYLVEWSFSDEHRVDTAKDLYSTCQELLKAHFKLPPTSEDLLLLRPGQVRLHGLRTFPQCPPDLA